MSSRFDIAKGVKPPEPEKLDIEPLVKYHANKNIKDLVRAYNVDADAMGQYVNYLGRTLNKKQIANLFADQRRLVSSYKNYFNSVVNRGNHVHVPDDEDILSNSINRVLRTL
jgi:hypothetical protein